MNTNFEKTSLQHRLPKMQNSYGSELKSIAAPHVAAHAVVRRVNGLRSGPLDAELSRITGMTIN